MPWKVAIFHIQSAIKTAFMKGITWNLAHTFFRVSSCTYIPVLKIFKFGGIFWKKNKNVEKISKFPKFQKSEMAVL